MPKLRQSGARLWKALRALTGDVRDVGESVIHEVREYEPAPGGGEREAARLHADVRFEPSDVSARGVVITGYSVLAGVGIVVCLLYLYFSFLSHYRARLSPPPLAMEAHGTPLPPAPRLQESPRRDLQGQQKYENSVLNKYWWADRQKGIVGLPIERAMELLVLRGIPPQRAPDDLKLFPPETGDRSVGFEGKAVTEPQ